MVISGVLIFLPSGENCPHICLPLGYQESKLLSWEAVWWPKSRQENSIFFHHFDYYCYWMTSKQATGQVTQGTLRIAPLPCYLDSSAMVPPRPHGDNISPTNYYSFHLHTLLALSVFLWGLHLSIWQVKFTQDRYRVTHSFQLTLKHKGNTSS